MLDIETSCVGDCVYRIWMGTSQMSKDPTPPGRVDMNKSVLPSREKSALASSSGVLISGPRWTGVPHGEEREDRVVTQKSSAPRPPAYPTGRSASVRSLRSLDTNRYLGHSPRVRD